MSPTAYSGPARLRKESEVSRETVSWPLEEPEEKKRFELVSWELAHSSNTIQYSHGLYKQRHHILEQGEDSLSVRSWREPLGFHLNSQPLNPKSLPTPTKQGVMGRNHSHGWPHTGHSVQAWGTQCQKDTHTAGSSQQRDKLIWGKFPV